MINKQSLLTGWNYIRLFRLFIGVFFAVKAFHMHDGMAGIIAVLFLFQALANTGCCGVNRCNVNI